MQPLEVEKDPFLSLSSILPNPERKTEAYQPISSLQKRTVMKRNGRVIGDEDDGI